MLQNICFAHTNIKFTLEHEHNNTFSFLEVTICCECNKLTTQVYRQPTFCGGFTNFKSLIPTVQRSDLVYALLHRCFNITSSYKKFHNEINALKQILKFNGYTIQFIDKCIKQFLQKLYVTKAIQDSVNKKQLLIVLPFLGVQSFLVTKLYKKPFSMLFFKNRLSTQNQTFQTILFLRYIPRNKLTHSV